MKRLVCRWLFVAACFASQGCAMSRGPAIGEVVIRAEGDAAPLACVVTGSVTPRTGDRIRAERRLRPAAAIPSARWRAVSASGTVGASAGEGCWTYTADMGRFVPGQRARIHRGG